MILGLWQLLGKLGARVDFPVLEYRLPSPHGFRGRMQHHTHIGTGARRRASRAN
jgi:hypothetical protein